MLVASFHCRPNVWVDGSESKVDKLVVVQNSRLRSELCRRPITIVDEITNRRSVCPRSFIEPAVYFQLRDDTCYDISRHLLSQRRHSAPTQEHYDHQRLTADPHEVLLFIKPHPVI